MQADVMRAPIACPTCAQELLTEFPSEAIAAALATGDTIRLFASCHDQVWDASYIEREQLKEYLQAQSTPDN